MTTVYHAALVQFLNYRLVLELSERDRILYLAVPAVVHETFFQREFLQISVERYQIHRMGDRGVKNDPFEGWRSRVIYFSFLTIE